LNRESIFSIVRWFKRSGNKNFSKEKLEITRNIQLIEELFIYQLCN
jgi:hypothetical protein